MFIGSTIGFSLSNKSRFLFERTRSVGAIDALPHDPCFSPKSYYIITLDANVPV